MYNNNNNSSGYGGNANYGGNNNYGANRPNNSGGYGGNSYGGNSYGGNNYGGNNYGGNSYGGNSAGSGYGGNNSGYGGNGGGYNSASRPGQYGQQSQQYGGNYGNNYGNGYGNNYGDNYGNNYGQQQGPIPGQETEEDVDRVAQQIRDVRQESLQSTRNAIRALQEADESAGRTLQQLGEQSEQLGRIERSLDSAQIHADNAQEKAGELKTVNRSMFAIHIKNPFNSTKRKERELEEAKRKAAEEMAQREAIRHEEYASKQRVNAAMGQGPYGRGAADSNGYRGGPGEQSMYSFENTAEDDEAERELDQNLDALGGLLGRLNQSALAMNAEVNRQNERMNGITQKTDNVHGSVSHNTQLLQKIAKRG